MHQGAAGSSVAESQIDVLTDSLNEYYKDIPKEPLYWVDYIWKSNEIDEKTILAIGSRKDLWGQEIPESKIGLVDIPLSRCSFSLCGQNNTTLRLILPNGVVCVRWNTTEEEFLQMQEENTYMTCCCTPGKNEYMGKISGEFLIEKMELRKKWVF